MTIQRTRFACAGLLLTALGCGDDPAEETARAPLAPDASGAADAGAPAAPMPAMTPAAAPQPPAVDTVAPEIPGVVAAGTVVRALDEGFNGTEGPLGMPDGTFLFTETNENRIIQIDLQGNFSTFLEDTNGSNGLGLTADGRLISVQTVPGQTQVGVIYPPGSEAVLTDEFEGQPYGRPNDLVVSTRGAVYFTEPGPNAAAGAAPMPPPLPPAVYHIAPDGAVQRVADGIERPNGIMLSRDEATLFVNNTNGPALLAFDVQPDGTLVNRREFAAYDGVTTNDNGVLTSGADGLAIDAEGRLYAATSVGVQVFDGAGALLGIIPLSRAPQNLAFAGPDKRSLYVVGRGAVYRVDMLAQGFAGRAK